MCLFASLAIRLEVDLGSTVVGGGTATTFFFSTTTTGKLLDTSSGETDTLEAHSALAAQEAQPQEV